MSDNLMQFRPRKGDTWEVRIPGKRKIVKRVGRVYRRYVSIYKDHKWIGSKRIIYVDWYRLPKGRYSGIRLKALIKYGKRISTKKEEDAHFKAMCERAEQRRQAKVETEIAEKRS